MKALTWHGKGDIRCEMVDDPVIEQDDDVIIKVCACAICGSDLHLMDGYMPTMQSGDVLGHESMGEVVEVGKGHSKFKVGDRVVVPFNLACGQCYFCQRQLYSLCDRSNRNAEVAIKAMGHSPSGLLGYSHMLGGYAGGQAEYLRVPYASVGPIAVPDYLTDEQALFLSDIFPTGFMAAENANIESGDTVAIWGCGPVGQFAIQSAWMLGAGRVIAIDGVPERLEMARSHGRAEILDFGEVDIYEALMEMTDGRGPDSCIDCVGTEAASGASVDSALDKVKAALFMGTDRPHVLRQAIMCCRKGGTISVPGVYVGLLDHVPFGAAMNKGLTFRMGQTHTHRYLEPLMRRVVEGEIDPTFVITHRADLEQGPELYKKFRDKQDGCVKVVMKPW
ncbi:zinc-dependent alcohol dehydrogenase [Limoniibacter endophyticus]|uniref:Glutathione-dependent formaldehyde dehydrogenase n=1 Tax=Limoniibacter endophyticus TaxID=1565040 RepID=A0A8J3GG14_9HYPH|nr:zinc-dependent alcohol dehydrogenase [Limoniibacter endophyticus]GHC66010.1 glutathione-dependent formaldehyde dehydrogenase [Limoniibacter endophyticus]